MKGVKGWWWWLAQRDKTKGQGREQMNRERERVIGLDRHLREARKLVVMMAMFIIAVTIILDPYLLPCIRYFLRAKNCDGFFTYGNFIFFSLIPQYCTRT